LCPALSRFGKQAYSTIGGGPQIKTIESSPGNGKYFSIISKNNLKT